MSEKELSEINGGARLGLNASSLNAISRAIGIIYDVGRACGSAISYYIFKKKCS